MRRPGSRFCRIEDSVLIVIFVVILWLPLLGMVLHLGVASPEWENRRLTPFPAISLKLNDLIAFPKQFELYFQDNFNFRQTLVSWQAIAKVKLLGTSPSPQVILGKEGWLFLATEYSNKGERLVPPFTQKQLEDWQRILEARRDRLAQRGIRYLFIIMPNKQTIYPEYLPDTFKRGEETRLDQLMTYLKKHSNVDILDLRPDLYKAKANHLLYYKHDTHWNQYGGFTAYQSIVRKLVESFPNLQPLSEADVEVTKKSFSEGDLAKLLGLTSVLTEEQPVLNLHQRSYKIIFNQLVPLTVNRIMVTQGMSTKLPRLVMFHDSGSNFINPFIAEHFSRSVFIFQKSLSYQLIENEHPDILIQEMAEMFLTADPPVDLSTDPPAVREMYLRSYFPEIPEGAAANALTGTYNGHHDTSDCGAISGWVWDSAHPVAKLKVDIYDGDTLLATVPADISREDLKQAGIGDGAHGFLYSLPLSLKNGQPHLIRVKIAGTKMDLLNTPRPLMCSSL